METEVLDKKQVSKSKAEATERQKIYHFQLLKTYEKYKPVEKNGGAPMTNAYPPFYSLPNDGVAFDEKTSKVRAWRLIQGQPSIWVDEQVGLERADATQIARLLALPENQIEFLKGSLFVEGIQKLKVDAIMVQDEFEGKKEQYRKKNPVFKLNNPDKDVAEVLASQYDRYRATNKAMSASDEQMLEFALALGIDTGNRSEAGMKRIRSEFFKRAEEKPDYFYKQFENPRNKIKWTFHEALRQNILSSTQIQDKLTWSELGTVIRDINSSGDITAELAELVIKKDKEMTLVYNTLPGLLDKAV